MGVFFFKARYVAAKKNTHNSAVTVAMVSKNTCKAEKDTIAVSSDVFSLLPLKFLLGHYGGGWGVNLCDSYEVSIKIVNSAWQFSCPSYKITSICHTAVNRVKGGVP